MHGPLEDEVDDAHDRRVLVDRDLLAGPRRRALAIAEALLEVAQRVADLAGVEVRAVDRVEHFAAGRDEQAHRRVRRGR